jgi:Zn-dependent protease with chaperone function
MSETALSTSPDIRVERWPSEIPLFVLAAIASAALWLLAVMTIIGLVYGAMLGVFFFVVHLVLVAHVRGNGVRVGPMQFPEVHAAVKRLAHRIGMKTVPEAYLIQGGGVLNAFATRFGRSDMVILYTDLLEACGDDHEARDMIIAHELGHLACGHVRWNFAIAPALLVPFLSGALSRAREYTCDRYGRAGAGTAEGAVLGMTILAAGGRFGRQLDRRVLASQRSALNTGWMTIGEWLSTHPPIVKRIAQLDPSLRDPSLESPTGVLRALGIIGIALTPVFVGGVVAALLFPAWIVRNTPARQAPSHTSAAFEPPSAEVGTPLAQRDFVELASFIREDERAGRGLPWDTREVYERWNAAHPGTREPRDPFDGTRYVYEQRGNRFKLWSVGPDAEWETDDDLSYDSNSPNPTGVGAGLQARPGGV